MLVFPKPESFLSAFSLLGDSILRDRSRIFGKEAAVALPKREAGRLIELCQRVPSPRQLRDSASQHRVPERAGQGTPLNDLTSKLNLSIMKIAKLLTMVSLALWMSVPAFAQEEKPAAQAPGMKRGMHEDRRAEMKAMDDRLDKLVVDMNAAATPDKKIDAAIAVVNEMVAQHKKMHERMAERGMKHHE